MTIKSQFEYTTEINSIAASIVQDAFEQCDNDEPEARDMIFDTLLNETVDGHQWVIYYAYNLDVIKYSDNPDYMADNFGGDALAESLKQGLDTLHMHIAYWALYADVHNALDDAIEQYKEENNLED